MNGKSEEDRIVSAAIGLDDEIVKENLKREIATAEAATAPVTMLYRNWRGETAKRTFVPNGVWFGTSEWHKEPQWFLKATDLDRNEERDFALKDFVMANDSIRELTLREAIEQIGKLKVAMPSLTPVDQATSNGLQMALNMLLALLRNEN